MSIHGGGSALELWVVAGPIVLSTSGREQGVVENGAPILPARRLSVAAARVEFERHAGVVGNLQVDGLGSTSYR